MIVHAAKHVSGLLAPLQTLLFWVDHDVSGLIETLSRLISPMTAPKKGFTITRDAFYVPARFTDYITGGKSKKPRLPLRMPAFNLGLDGVLTSRG